MIRRGLALCLLLLTARQSAFRTLDALRGKQLILHSGGGWGLLPPIWLDRFLATKGLASTEAFFRRLASSSPASRWIG